MQSTGSTQPRCITAFQPETSLGSCIPPAYGVDVSLAEIWPEVVASAVLAALTSPGSLHPQTAESVSEDTDIVRRVVSVI